MDQLKQANRLGIQLGGVWQDFHDRIKHAEESRALAEEMLSKMTIERDHLQAEKDYLMYKFRENMASLTDSETNHLEAKQIIETIRQEKQDLTSKCLSLETQRDWLEDQNKLLKSTNLKLDESLNASMKRIQELEAKLAEELKESKTLNELVFKKDERIEEVQKMVRAKEEELDILNKSLFTRDRQYQTLLKERDKLRDDAAKYDKIIHKVNGLSANRQQQHHIQLREEYSTPKSLSVKNRSHSTARPTRQQATAFVTPDKNTRFAVTPSSSSSDGSDAAATSNECTPSDSGNAEERDPYSDLFDGLTNQLTPVTPPPPPPTHSHAVTATTATTAATVAAVPIKEVRSQTVNQFLCSNKSSGIKEKLSESLLSRYRDQLEAARTEIERLEALAVSRAQQSRIIVNAEELRKHQRITSPAFNMTRRSTGSTSNKSVSVSPVGVTASHSAQKNIR